MPKFVVSYSEMRKNHSAVEMMQRKSYSSSHSKDLRTEPHPCGDWRVLMEKKEYRAPKLKSKKVELGVFGDYSDGSNGRGGNVTPLPSDIVRKLDLHME